MSKDKLSLPKVMEGIKAPWQPSLIASINGTTDLKVAKFSGSFVWHAHPATDELFYVLGGGPLEIGIRDPHERTVRLEKGELFVVPKGVEHCPGVGSGPEREAWVLMAEGVGTVNTGTATEGRSDLTYTPDDVRT